jgi:hypothetical protein
MHVPLSWSLSVFSNLAVFRIKVSKSVFSGYFPSIHLPVCGYPSICLHSTRRIHAMRLIRLHSSATTSPSNYIHHSYSYS